jgi:VWFA-related protein
MTVRSPILAAGLILAAVAAAGETPETPRDVGMVERASTRLAQIDVTVSGPRGAIEGLTAADFEVRLNDKIVSGVLVDNLCVATPERASAIEPPRSSFPAPAAGAAPRPREETKGPIATYLFYFDMVHLTQSGRQASIAAARQMAPKLLAGGQRGMIVASAADLKTVVPLTTDAVALDAALAKMVDDRETFDTYAALEESRLADIIRELDISTDAAMALARRYAADERWRQERDLSRLSMVLGRLSELDEPKAVLYFADTMRQNAGEHYLSFFSGTTLTDPNGKPVADADSIATAAAMGALPLDRVMNEAAGLGIRFYTIEGQGITGPNNFIQSRGAASGNANAGGGNQAAAGVNSQRVRDSQGTLTSLAAETGGRAFLNGVPPSRMTTQILGDLSCLYLLSFDPKGFPQDKPLSVAVKVARPKVKTMVRGRLVIQSESTRLTARLLSAFVSPTGALLAGSAGVSVGLIPIAYEDGHYKARVQVALGGSSVPMTIWDVGASLVSNGARWQDGSGRIEVTSPNTPVVFEKDMEFAPGEYEIRAVAHELETDTLLSKELHGTFPKIDADLASIGPIALSQPRSGGFLRDGHSQSQGAVVVADGDVVRGETPTAVIELICRAKDQKRPLDVSRTLFGEGETPVGKNQLDLTTERCAQIVDLIPAKTLGAGRYRFVVTVSSDGTELTRAERTFDVPEKPQPPPAKPS